MNKLLTTADAVRRLGVHKSTVVRMARRLKVGVWIGDRPGFTAEEIEKMRPFVRERGCPKFVPGNRLWKRRKKSKK